MSVSSFFC